MSMIATMVSELREVETSTELEILVATNAETERGRKLMSHEFMQTLLHEAQIRVSGLVYQAEPKAEAAPVVRSQPRPRSAAVYRLVNAEVSWSERNQVLILGILIQQAASATGTFTDDDVIELIEVNRVVLKTRQPAKSLWNYYKGAGGFVEHGNIERIE